MINKEYIPYRTCAMCKKKFPTDIMFSPMACLRKYGVKYCHKICSKCWWSKFAEEGGSHPCPGCKKGMKLPPKISNKNKEVIDLLDD